MVSHELSKPRRIELILRQIDTLPTLPAVATKLLALTADDDSNARQVTELIQSDPSLTAKVLSLCRTADKGVRHDILTIDRAVVLLGFSTIRNAVLSVKVLEVFEGRIDGDLDYPLYGSEEPASVDQGSGIRGRESKTDHQHARSKPSDTTRSLNPEPRPPAPALDRPGFWMHSLAVAIAAEQIARAHRDPQLPADEAFVCGLLHDIGKLALDHVLPRSFGRVLELADVNRGDIAQYERKIIGVDHHTAGKRLAEQWNLPLRLQDCIWLHGSPWESLPRVEHRRMIGLVQLADAVVRQRHIGFSGNYRDVDLRLLCQRLGLDADKLPEATADLFPQLEQRGQALGIHDEPCHELALAAIQRANAALGRTNAALQRRSRWAQVQEQVLQTLSGFNASMTPGRSVQDVMDAVAASAQQLLGEGLYTVIHPTRHAGSPADHHPPRADGHWLVSQYNRRGEPAEAQYFQPPPHTPDLAQLDASGSTGMSLMNALPWLGPALSGVADPAQVKLLPLPCGWGTIGVLLHDRPSLPGWNLLGPLAGTWGNALAAAAQHSGAKRLSEELAAAGAALAAAQEKLTAAQSLARLGEMAAGAAHEMNNPLAVIAGRSQLMAATLTPGTEHHRAAQLIFRESHRLSDLITSLRMIADPPVADRRPADVAALLRDAVTKVRKASAKLPVRFGVDLDQLAPWPTMQVDAGQVSRAVTELLMNAVQANPRSAICLKATLESRADSMDAAPPQRLFPAHGTNTHELPGRAEYAQHAALLRILVTDDGDGMDRHTLRHALDPFFSNKPAGRQVGMGLPRAQQLAAAHGGSVGLRSEAGTGTVATLLIPLDWPQKLADDAGGPAAAAA